ncbi:D-amino acid dehydrogenase [Defluviimonas sp. WL0075]|uniref:D-amino acid dehydrogenase n=1 Tax=Albidovulum sediminicola TaxID=2984331 RepID=A0ABT2Z5S5_9RHOB|nr:D-amino acid dehydrogenase [Defluviimonas sp. WL0075]MCV2866131.1 D-amino acid dehydrogenase [Defluviimonas sp. WL0075]
MHIVVLGAGMVGITTAYQLLRDGHAVTVLERADAPAEFTSYANAGLVAPGHAYAWGSPAAPGMMWRSLIRGDQAIRFSPRLSPRQWKWALAFLRECTAERAAANTGVKARLCRFSQRMLEEVVAETGVTYDGRGGGLLYFYRSAERFSAASQRADLLRDQGLEVRELSRDEVIATDPGLETARGAIAGGLFAPTDASGDARLFTRALAGVCTGMGADIRYGTTVTGLTKAGGSIRAVETSAGSIAADAVVLCLGVYSPHLAETLGFTLPVYPVKGYSVTVSARDLDQAPTIGGVDEENLLAYCPMGERLRLTATAEIAGYSTAHKPADFNVMLTRARELFGDKLGASGIEYWAGLRPMTPTGLPIVDRSPIDNLFLNTGHGHMGWTMSNGCARMTADLIGQKALTHSNEGMRYDG